MTRRTLPASQWIEELHNLDEQFEAQFAASDARLARVTALVEDVQASLDEDLTGEGFTGRGYADANDLVDFSKYDMARSPSSRGELDNPRPAHVNATVQDMSNVCNKVAARHHASVSLVRVLDNGFVSSLVIPGGLYQGTTSPSVSDVEQKMIQALREVAPAAVVDLITNDEITGSGPTSRRLIFRFRLRDELGGF